MPASSKKQASRRVLGGVSRRRFAGLAAGAIATLAAPALAQGRARVVVVGGGAGGATVARYVARDSERLEVVLINDAPRYTSCFFSNLFLSGLRSLRSITHPVATLSDRYGIVVLIARATAVDRDSRTVRLNDGAVVAYDRLVMAPGIGFRFGDVEGLDASARAAMPHAYSGGLQTYALRRKLLAMPQGGVFALTPPPNPYRCPPGPYERVSMIANLFRRANPTAKILVIDAKDGFPKQSLFLQGWRESYRDMVEWLPAAETGGGLARVDAGAMTLETGIGDRVKVDAASVIPPQKAAPLVEAAGLVDSSGWAPVDGGSMRSLRDPNIFVVGDSALASPMPKSGFAANSQAHVAALAIRADLDGATLFPARYRNTCWSFIDNQNVVKVGANYVSEDGAIKQVGSFVSAEDETVEKRLENTLEANGWYGSITADMFG